MGKNGLCFFGAAAILGLLAYGPFGWSVKVWIFILLTLILFGAAFLWVPAAKESDAEKFLSSEKGFPAPPMVLFWVLAVFALFLRFFDLTDFHFWPTGDEGLNGFLALSLCRHWSWHFFYAVGELPPLLTWLLALGYRLSTSAFFAIWFPPALFSALALGAGYAAARLFFSKSLATLFGILLAFSFWPLDSGRYCHQGILVPFWELTCFYLFGRFLKASQGNREKWALFLGLWTGLGTLTFPSWLSVLLLAILTFLLTQVRDFQKNFKPILVWGLGLSLGGLPFVLAVLREGYGHHFLDASAASGWYSPAHQWMTHASYLTSFFWGTAPGGASYGPFWGGMLNPILGAGFFLGFFELLRLRKIFFSKWWVLAAFFCFLPGLLASDYVELNRVLQVMPLLLLMAAFGFQRLYLDLGRRALPVVLLLLAASFGLDMIHLAKSRTPLVKTADANYAAFQILEAQRLKEGPGLIFSDFLLLSHNHSLSACVYPFNAAVNSRLNPAAARWAAVIVNPHYERFLAARFPGSSWAKTPLEDGEGGLVVGILPVTDANEGLFSRWKEAHDYFGTLNLEAEQVANSQAEYQKTLSQLPEGYAWVAGDPFLESIYGEWLAQYHYGADYSKNIEVLRRAVTRGYPAAHLYFKLGNFLWADGKTGEARRAYARSLALDPEETGAAQALAGLSGNGKF